MSNILMTFSSSSWLKMKIRGANTPITQYRQKYDLLCHLMSCYDFIKPILELTCDIQHCYTANLVLCIESRAQKKTSGSASGALHPQMNKAPSKSFESSIFPKKLSLIAEFHCPTLSRNGVPQARGCCLVSLLIFEWWTSRIQVLDVSWLR